MANDISSTNRLKSNISPTPYKSKYEYFDDNIENNIDELQYVYSLPKSGFSSFDYLLRNGEKFSTRVVADNVEVLTKGNIRGIYCNKFKIPLRIDDFVVVECENGLDIGRVSDLGQKSDCCKKQNANSYNIINVPDLEELKLFNLKIKDEAEVLQKARELVALYKFEMKITEASWQHDRQRLTIFFTAPQRIDFRDMVKELARLFRARIELRQISAREETKRLGNFVGPCGRELCCTSFLNNFDHVTLDHARAQQLSNNISKLSGNCGRLKCCIKFEYDTYALANEKYPPIGSVIVHDNKSMKIIKIDIFNSKITTYCEQDSLYKQYSSQELSEMIREGKLIIFDKRDTSDRFSHFDEDLKAILE